MSMQNETSHDHPLDHIPYGWILWMTLRGAAVPFELLLHRNMGRDYPGMPGIFSLGIQLAFLYLSATEGLNPVPQLTFSGCFFVVLVFRRIQSTWLERRGYGQPPAYCGTPLLCVPLSWFSEEFIRRWIEPFLLAGIGICFAPIAPVLTLEFGIGAFSMMLAYSMSDYHIKYRVQRMHDQMNEQKILAERFRQHERRHF